MKTWRTKDGKFILLNKMADKHIANAYRLCCKAQEEIRAAIHHELFYSDEDGFHFSFEKMKNLELQEHRTIGWASTLSKELTRRGYHRIGDRFVKGSI